MAETLPIFYEYNKMRSIHFKMNEVYHYLYNKIKDVNPNKIIELGSGSGGLTVALALALKEINSNGKIYGFDTFDEIGQYGHTYGSVEEAMSYINEAGVSSYVEYTSGDVFTHIDNKPEFFSNFDVLYIDLNNTWDIIFDVVTKIESVKLQVKNGSHVFIEGGHRNHPRMNESTLEIFHKKIGKEVFKFTHLAGPRVSVSQLDFL
tara:strand:- start:315 stop:929 length:615 start_codon:yes stop_codon:yes gene_type:complete